MPALPQGDVRLDMGASKKDRLLSSLDDGDKDVSPLTAKPRWAKPSRNVAGDDARRTCSWRSLRAFVVKALAVLTALTVMGTFWRLHEERHGAPHHQRGKHHGWTRPPLPWRPWHRPHLTPMTCFDVPPAPPTSSDSDALRHSANFSLTLSDPLAAIFTHHTLASSRIEIVRDEMDDGPFGNVASPVAAEEGGHLPIPPHRPMTVMVNAFQECPSDTDASHGLTAPLLDEMEKDEPSIQICSLKVPSEGAGLAVRLHVPEGKKGEVKDKDGEEHLDTSNLFGKLPPKGKPIRLVLRLHAPAGAPLSLSALLPPPPGEIPPWMHHRPGHGPHGPPHHPGHGPDGPPPPRHGPPHHGPDAPPPPHRGQQPCAQSTSESESWKTRLSSLVLLPRPRFF